MATNGSLNGRRRVVITGLGAVTPLGNDVETTWTNLISGRSGAGPITQFDCDGYPVTFACEVKDFDPTEYMDRKQARRMDRFAHLVLAAARQAEADSGLDVAAESDRIGAAVATGIGGLKSFQDCRDELRDRGADRVSPFSIPEIIPNMGAALGVDGARHAGAALVPVHGVCRLEHVDRRRAGRDPAGPRRRDVLRRDGSAGHRGRHCRLRGHARAVAAERRSGAGKPAVRRGSRRLRDGRRRRRSC